MDLTAGKSQIRGPESLQSSGGGGAFSIVRPAALGFILLFVVATLAATAARAFLFPPRVEQPIAFNHRKHVEELELDCSTCHEFYEKRIYSGLPGAEVCSMCHLTPQGDSEEEAKLVRLLEEGAPLEWKPLFRQPPHIFFSHRRHVVSGGIDCATCHRSMGRSDKPPTRVDVLSMDQCVDCHREGNVPADCTTCHR